jgi:amino acid transporter
MKRIHFPKYSIVAFLIVFLLSIFIFIADLLLDENGIYFYTGISGFTTGDLFVTIFLIGGGLFVSAIAVFLHKNLKLKWLKIIIILLSALISIIFLGRVMIANALVMPHTYVELLSDDSPHNIIIGEDCYFFSPYGGDVFEKTSFCTIKKLGKYVAKKDFYTPFSDGKYSVTWNDENFELFYDSDGDGELDEKILFEYLP